MGFRTEGLNLGFRVELEQIVYPFSFSAFCCMSFAIRVKVVVDMLNYNLCIIYSTYSE